MNLFDTHTHLYLPEFDEDRHDVVDRALEAGVGTMLLPNVDLTTIVPMKELASRYPDNMLMAMGLHPTEVDSDFETPLATISAELHSDNRYVAVGEIGIDLYWDKTFIDQQMQAFSRQVEWAVQSGLPIIIHCRDGLDRTLEVLDDFRGRVNGVFHSFGGSPEDVERIRDRAGDFHFGINGIVTFRNSRLRHTLPAIGLERILLETDAPYLAPVPHRGRRNETSYILNTAAAVAEALGYDTDEVARTTTRNARSLFLERSHAGM